MRKYASAAPACADHYVGLVDIGGHLIHILYECHPHDDFIVFWYQVKGTTFSPETQEESRRLEQFQRAIRKFKIQNSSLLA